MIDFDSFHRDYTITIMQSNNNLGVERGQCSFYRNVKVKENVRMDISEFVNQIRNGRWRNEVTRYRQLKEEGKLAEAARIKEQEAKPVFAILEPVIIPNRKTAPSKAKILVIFTFLAGCCAAGWVLLGEDYWKKLKENL